MFSKESWHCGDIIHGWNVRWQLQKLWKKVKRVKEMDEDKQEVGLNQPPAF
jgi:hypothetical protein